MCALSFNVGGERYILHLTRAHVRGHSYFPYFVARSLLAPSLAKTVQGWHQSCTPHYPLYNVQVSVQGRHAQPIVPTQIGTSLRRRITRVSWSRSTNRYFMYLAQETNDDRSDRGGITPSRWAPPCTVSLRPKHPKYVLVRATPDSGQRRLPPANGKALHPRPPPCR